MSADRIRRLCALARRFRAEEPPKGLDALWHRAVGAVRRMSLRARRFLARADRVVALEPETTAFTDDSLRDTAARLRERFLRGRAAEVDLEHACALIREVARRQIGEHPYREQVAGALAMHAGCIAEMATGEGKTLAAVFPAVLAAWRGRGCHIVTVNDYLARRDAEWMAPIYRFFGLQTSHISEDTPGAARREAYEADITYVSNKEATADFLRDRLVLGQQGGLVPALVEALRGASRPAADRFVQRGLECAIVDEADSILVDEAVTPLLISAEAPNPGQEEAVVQARRLAEDLESPRDYRVDPRYGEIEFTPAGRERLRKQSAGLSGLWTGARRSEELMVQALTARHFYRRDKQYVVKGGFVVIVDEFTGRLMPDRTWREGLHAAIEAKEGVTVHLPKDTVSRVSFQRYFRLYRWLCGMTGTAWEARGELWHVYRLPVCVIPVHRPCLREVAPDRVFLTADARWSAVLEEAQRIHATGRPVLIGTRSIGASQHLSRMLSEAGIAHQVLNGVQNADEAEVVARAGQKGTVTVATNMAGRGTDIRLGPGVVDLGGLAVIATERHEAGRIDRQLFGRSARQGDPGTAHVFASLEDDLVVRFAPALARSLAKATRVKDQEITGRLASRLLALSQGRAERRAARLRRSVLQTDHQFDEALGFTGEQGQYG